MGLLQALLSSLLGAAHLVIVFLCLAIALQGYVKMTLGSPVLKNCYIAALQGRTLFSPDLISRCLDRPMSQTESQGKQKTGSIVTWPCPFTWLLLLSGLPVREAVTQATRGMTILSLCTFIQHHTAIRSVLCSVLLICRGQDSRVSFIHVPSEKASLVSWVSQTLTLAFSWFHWT